MHGAAQGSQSAADGTFDHAIVLATQTLILHFYGFTTLVSKDRNLVVLELWIPASAGMTDYLYI
jgi:hypothetical protein